MQKKTRDLIVTAIEQLQKMKNETIWLDRNVSEHVEWSLQVMLEDVIDTIRVHGQESRFSYDPKMLEEFFS